MINKKEAGIGKRGLSMIFAIAGVAIVVIAALVVFFTSEDVQIGRRITTTQVSSIESYLEDCVEDRIQKEIKIIKLRGGDLVVNNPGPGVYSGFNMLVDLSRENKLNSVNNIENILAERIRSYIVNGECAVKDVFSGNFEIDENTQNINVKVTLSNNAVNVEVRYLNPILVKRDNLITQIDVISVNVEDNLKLLRDASGDLINYALGEFVADRNPDYGRHCMRVLEDKYKVDLECVKDNRGSDLVRVNVAGEEDKFMFVIAR